VVDEDGVCYVGSADHTFYAINEDGTVKWSIKTGEIIDSSALRTTRASYTSAPATPTSTAPTADTGEIVWKSQADTTDEVEAKYNIVTYNVNWFEGNIGMLPDGELLAPNDNYLVYRVNRETGEMENAYLANEMVWSLPSINAATNRLYFASCYQILKNVFSYDMDGARKWLTGSFGTVAATTMLTSDKANGAVVVGGFDGYVRALAQDNGKLLVEGRYPGPYLRLPRPALRRHHHPGLHRRHRLRHKRRRQRSSGSSTRWSPSAPPPPWTETTTSTSAPARASCTASTRTAPCAGRISASPRAGTTSIPAPPWASTACT
jgi:outer membrane protein assembly factor BamB